MNGEAPLEALVALWRDYLKRHRSVHSPDVEELEDHLRAEIATLTAAGLSENEAFLVAVKRLGNLDELSREFAREHSERLWKQLVVGGDGEEESEAETSRRKELLVVLGLASLAALAFKIPELFGVHLFARDLAAQAFYARNLSLFVFPFLAAYFVWKRAMGSGGIGAIAAAFAGAALLVNLYPFHPDGQTLLLTFVHLPIALWMAVGIAYVGGEWRSRARRMDFLRFSGELFIYYTLIALGGGLLSAFSLVMFQAIGVNVMPFVSRWLLPCGALGAVIVGAWLVEAKQSVIENMAPVLTRLFTPLFTLVLLAFLATMGWTRTWISIERNVLIGFDLLLAVVVGLVLYTISARDPEAPAGAFDALQLLLVLAALVVDSLALAAIVARISDFGFSANKVAALGENIVLLGNLLGAALLYVRFLRGKVAFTILERWQTTYLPVYFAWAWLVVALFPPLFGFR
ncbi:MAG TPA: permease prefix domain 1-containing protein [Thermoanaerobaculia bacterium]|nr:permease prefix domain 1-containing protein [Thermoanaerobaculia bacterium]